MGNLVNGLDVVTTTVALTLDSFIKNIKLEIPGIKVAYDESLTYETAKEVLRSNNVESSTLSDLYPLFAFNRSVLRYAEPAGPGRRASGMMAKRDMSAFEKPNTSNIYRLVHGEFDIRFLYITKSARALELFEILYLSEEGISSYKELEVDLRDTLGTSFIYYADYLPLEDKIFNDEQVYYKMIQGTIKVRGFYPVLRGESKHILSINAKISSFLSEVLFSKIIN